jgi:hypothetical protein
MQLELGYGVTQLGSAPHEGQDLNSSVAVLGHCMEAVHWSGWRAHWVVVHPASQRPLLQAHMPDWAHDKQSRRPWQL